LGLLIDICDGVLYPPGGAALGVSRVLGEF